MFIIGERINGMFKAVGEAIKKKDHSVIQELAKKQIAAGADCLDVNVGPVAEDPTEAMIWLVKVIRQVFNGPVAIDSPKPAVLEAGLQAAGDNAIINSTTGVPEKLNTILPLAVKYNAAVIGLTISEKGVPADSAGRMEVAANIVASAMEKGIMPDMIYIDGVILPVNVAQPQCQEVMKLISEVRMISNPAPKTVLGLSNVSQGTKQRPLINRTYLAMAIGYGLDAAIMDPLDKDLMDAAITADLLMNRHIYCDSYLEAYRKK